MTFDGSASDNGSQQTAELRPIVVRTVTGDELPPVLTTYQAARILGIAHNTVVLRCAAGMIPTLERFDNGPWQIVTVKLLRQLGLLADDNQVA